MPVDIVPSLCGNIHYQDTLRDVTGYRHCRFVVMSHTWNEEGTALYLWLDLFVVFVIIIAIWFINLSRYAMAKNIR